MKLGLLKSAVQKWGIDTFRKTGVRQWTIAVLFFVALGGMLLANVVTDTVDVSVGQVAPRDIEAPFRAINRYETDRLRATAADRAVKEAVDNDANYVINQAVAIKARELVADVFERIAAARGQDADPGVIAAETSAALNQPIDAAQVRIALSLSEERSAQLKSAASALAAEILGRERLKSEDLEEARAGIPARVAALRPGDVPLSAEERTLVAAVVAGALEPNLLLDLQRVNRAREEAIAEVKPVYVERGQIIVRKGDLVSEEDIRILQDLGLLRSSANYVAALGILLIVALLVGLFGVYLYQCKRQLLTDEGHLALLALVLILVAGITKVLSVFPSEAFGYLAPVALGTMLIAILLDAHVAIVSAVFLSVIVGLTMGQELKFAVVALVSGLTGVFGVSKVGERAHLTRAGGIVGLVTFAAMLSFGLYRADMFMVQYSPLGVINGLVSAIGAIGLFPYLESVFGITSSIRLLELSNPNQPLLRKLLMEAPGTYHHSMIVGNLAEAAAEAIGGDSLLTRVGAQYHDIGKTKRPYFFIENQYGGENPHDKMSPYLSTLIITNHVKEGVDLARKHRLPECVIDFIRQHHGTTLVKYFYNKAKEMAKDENCDEKDFRYPGPRPQTKETAIVLLADSVEAAVRTLSKPTPGRIEGLVRKIIKDHLADGQLDESNITLRDLDKVAEAFVKVLTGIFHSRIEYPDNLIKEMEAKRA